MEKLTYSIELKAKATKVWQMLWNDETYRIWTEAFQAGSYAVSDWKEGDKIQFLSQDGSGMYSKIVENKPNMRMSFKHIGNIKNFEEQPIDEETKEWANSLEAYYLTETNGITKLDVSLNSVEQYKDYFDKTFPLALDKVKALAENPYLIIIEIEVNIPIEKVWEYWTMAEHITHWNFASDDWRAPFAENDLKVGGKFIYRMEAKDGSFGFDLEGIYDEIKYNELIKYHLADDRLVEVLFKEKNNSTVITQTFEAELENKLELQRSGWQAVLTNFKKYAESI